MGRILDPVSSSGSRTVRVTMPLASDNAATNTVSATDFLQRFPILLPVTTTRWRIRVRNSRLTGGAITGAMTLTDLYVGTPAVSNIGAATNAFTATPTKALAIAGNTFGDTEYVSPWVSDPTLQFQADTMAMISCGWTNAVNQVISYNGSSAGGAKSMGIVYTGAGASASAGSATPGGTNGVGPMYGDWRLEYESFSELPVVLIVGDSTSVGFTDDLSKVGYIYGGLTVNGWPAQAALRERFMWANASVQGAKTADFVTSSDPRYARLDLATTVPDAAIISLGINDASALIGLTTYQQNIQSIITALKTLGVKRVYVTTVLPQPQFKPGVILAAVASGVTTMKTSVAYANADAVSLDYGFATAETLTVSGASVADGSGAYTTTFTAASTQPHALMATISVSTESRRRDYNEYLRAIRNTNAVFDFARETADGRYGLDMADPLLWGSGTIHPGTGGYLAMATQVRIPTWALT